MKSYRYIQSIMLAMVVFALVSCADDDFMPMSGEESIVAFDLTMDQEMQTRAIGDASSIDQLIVSVFDDNAGKVGNKIFDQEMSWSDALNKGVKLTLIQGRSYHLLFWAQHKDNGAYAIGDDGKVSVNYDNFKSAGFTKMEQLDLFYTTASLTVGTKKVEDKGKIALTRPLAQVNIADNKTPPVKDSHKAVVEYSAYPTTFNPFAGTIEMSQTPIEFTFADFPAETLSVGGDTYYYLACNYFFAPSSGTQAIETTTVRLQDMSGNDINKVSLIDNGVKDNRVVLARNNRTNVYGSIVAPPEAWSVWDGKSKTKPGTDSDSRYVIDNASDLVWLSENDIAAGTFIQTTDIDMNGYTLPVRLPEGSTYDGGGKQIINYDSSIFGDATSVAIKNLSLSNITASSTTHVGVLVNTLSGSSQITNVAIEKSSATTEGGAAGGIVGYVVRKSEKEQSETLTVAFSGCTLNDVAVAGSASEGKMVGLLSGYDNKETLTFDATCEANNVGVADYASVYVKANQSAWVAGTLDAKYNGWLGHETYRRGKVSFAGVRMVPRWDGTIDDTVKKNLIKYRGADKKYEVYSPYDLAAVRDTYASLEALYLMENVDMYGQGADKAYDVPHNWTQSANSSDDDIYFKSFSTITYLEGNGNGIYNLNINTQKISTGLYYGGFIQSTSGTTTHQNIKFYDSCVVVPHVVYKNEDKGSAGMLVSNIAGDSYTMNNVHTYGCKIFALQKVGGLAARVAATSSSITGCSVNNGYIENYECKANLEEFGGGLASFYSYGEVGGLFGFVQDGTIINKCNVNGTTIYAYGQADQLLGAVPGRHVSLMIGDIRTYVGGTITIKESYVDSATISKIRHDQHSYGGWFNKKNVKEIGKCYYVATDDTKGKVVFNGTTIFS